MNIGVQGDKGRRSSAAVWAGAVLVLALVGTVILAPNAHAQIDPGNLVYVQDGDVWRAPGDDLAAGVQLTTSGQYVHVAQGVDGSLLAVLGDELTVVPLTSGGLPNGEPFRPSALGGGISALDISPSGEVFAYSGVTPCPNSPMFQLCGYTEVAYTDGRDRSDIDFFRAGGDGMSFYADDDVVWVEDENVQIHALRSGVFDTWIDGGCGSRGICDDPEISPDGRIIAGKVNGFDEVRRVFFNAINLYELGGPPPTPLSDESCFVRTPRDESFFFNPTWSPDGTQLVFSEAYFEGSDFFQVGLWRASGIGVDTCEEVMASVELVREGNLSSPDWGPAAFVSPPAGGGIEDGSRLDGGGSADPIAQAIATSQYLFPDGTAARVVLATADRFPDALAGAALAGRTAPILLTNGLGGLDPRVATEIGRVTGGAGQVLVLGGGSAVSAAAASQARQAGGDQPCADPLPADCRYAGSGREDTAALIGGTVLAEHPGATVLLARGDDFADAITGGAYAARASVPVLLTPSTSLNGQTAAFIAANAVERVVVLGGTAAVDEATVQSIDVGLTERVAGAERTETAANISRDLWDTGGASPSGVVLVNVRDAGGWQTALTAAVASARFNAPQLGVENPPTGLSMATTAALGRIGGPVMAFGSAGLVSGDQLAEAIASAGRAARRASAPAQSTWALADTQREG